MLIWRKNSVVSSSLESFLVQRVHMFWICSIYKYVLFSSIFFLGKEVLLFFSYWYTRVAKLDVHIFFWTFIFQDYRERNAYILTQAPLENTIKDFWLMISLYNIGTVVMLSNLKEGRQVRIMTCFWKALNNTLCYVFSTKKCTEPA